MPNRLLVPRAPRKVGGRYKYMSLTFWPEHGFIYVEDDDDNSFTTVNRRDWLERAAAFNREVKKLGSLADTAGNSWQKSSAIQEREALASLVDVMVTCARRAKRQGDPTDPKVVAWIQKHAVKRPSRLVPGINGNGSGLILPGNK